MSGKYSILVLAAGRSTRMPGRHKLLLPLGNSTIIAHTVENAIAGQFNPVIVVTGYQADAIKTALHGLPVVFEHNPDFENGMATSLICGLAAVPDEADGCIVMLGDMPLISGPILQAIAAEADRWPDAPAIIPVFRGQWAHPVLLRRSLFPFIRQLRGDQGARGILEKQSGIATITFDDEGILLDADTPEAYDDVRRRFALQHG